MADKLQLQLQAMFMCIPVRATRQTPSCHENIGPADHPCPSIATLSQAGRVALRKLDTGTGSATSDEGHLP